VTAAADANAVLVIRAWTEDGPLRARITATTDASRHHERIIAAATPDQVLAAVQAWLDRVTRQQKEPNLQKVTSGDVSVTLW
jgi:hypothetical protein